MGDPIQVIRPFAQQGRGVRAELAYQGFQEPLGVARNRGWGSHGPRMLRGTSGVLVRFWRDRADMRGGPVTDPVNPPHYQGDVECIDALRAALSPEEFRGYCRGSAIAYLWRLGRKDAPEQEARKAAWFVAWLAGEDPRSAGRDRCTS